MQWPSPGQWVGSGHAVTLRTLSTQALESSSQQQQQQQQKQVLEQVLNIEHLDSLRPEEVVSPRGRGWKESPWSRNEGLLGFQC